MLWNCSFWFMGIPYPKYKWLKILHHLSRSFFTFLWVYPLRHKSNVFSKFLHFPVYVQNHFTYDIQKFQCDNRGELDNKQFHNLFYQHGVIFRFSCPRTSQQKGEKECMIYTINNIIHSTFLRSPSTHILGRSSTNGHPSSQHNALLVHSKWHTIHKTIPKVTHLFSFTCVRIPMLPPPSYPT